MNSWTPDKSLKHGLSLTCVIFWFLTQEMEGSRPFTVMTNIFVIEIGEFIETVRKNSIDRAQMLRFVKLVHCVNINLKQTVV